jgi:hypothetical protein
MTRQHIITDLDFKSGSGLGTWVVTERPGRVNLKKQKKKKKNNNNNKDEEEGGGGRRRRRSRRRRRNKCLYVANVTFAARISKFSS